MYKFSVTICTVVCSTVANPKIAIVRNAKGNEKRHFNMQWHVHFVLRKFRYGKIINSSTIKESEFNLNLMSNLICLFSSLVQQYPILR